VLYKSEKLPVPRWLAWQEELPWLPVWGAVGLGLALLAMIVWPFGPRQTLGAGLRWLPGGGRLLDELQAARAAQLLALLLRYSVPWPEALRLTGAALAQPRWRRPLEELAEAASRGELPQQGRRRLRGVPPFLAWLLASGAGQSDLVPALSHAAEYYRERALARGAWMQQVLPAATVVLVGGAITLLYGLAVFGPMTELWEQLARAGQ
jgi:type II secretory pathway component PulF